MLYYNGYEVIEIDLLTKCIQCGNRVEETEADWNEAQSYRYNGKVYTIE